MNKMKSIKLKVVLLLTAALIILTACGTTNSDNNNKDTKFSNTVATRNSTISVSTTMPSIIENNAEKYQRYEDVNKGQKPEEVYADFINTVKNDEDYGNDPL